MKILIKKNSIYLWIISILFTLMFANNSESKYEKIFFDHSIKSIDGKTLDLNKFYGKAILLVNVASNCGFTKQYADLQKLWDTYKNIGLVVIGVPSNQFGGQEPGTNNEIKEFCEVNFNISFLITDKIDVKGENAHEIYTWAKKNYGKAAVPKWNFHKILIDKDGKVADTYASFTNPMSKKITSKIEKILN